MSPLVGKSTKAFQLDMLCKPFKVLRYSFSEAIPIFFNRLKSGFFPCLITIKFSPVIGYGFKFVKMYFFIKINITTKTIHKKL